jgi:4-carboxymuconolactone decarboxylase
MSEASFPGWYLFIKENFGGFVESLEQMGEVVRKEGPLDDKTSHLIQLAAAAGIRSEGSVHSHVRRALKAGAKPEEIYHALLLLTSTVGFPTVAAALSWAYDVLGKEKE